MKKIIIVVDGYSSGAQLPFVLNNHEWRCVHVKSQPNLPLYFLKSFRKEDYLEEFVFEGDLADLVERLKLLEPSAILPGAETGVILANQLANALGLPGNDPEASEAHRNKYAMATRIKSHGLRAPQHYLASDESGLLAWANKGSWPVVLKPVASAGTDSVIFCENKAELLSSFRELRGTTNRLGGSNETLLVQRMLRGQEYFINGISGYGRHIITEVWRTDKIKVEGAGLIYDRTVLIDPSDPTVKDIVEYVYDVLTALGIEYGASHTEVMDTEEGPTLIECASRLSGGINREVVQYALGDSQIDLAAKLVVEGESFINRLTESPRRLRSPVWQVQLISNQSGVLEKVFFDKLSEALHSRVWLHNLPKAGDVVKRTVDLFSSPGIIFMSHPDPAVLQADYETIRDWEHSNRLFKVEERALSNFFFEKSEEFSASEDSKSDLPEDTEPVENIDNVEHVSRVKSIS